MTEPEVFVQVEELGDLYLYDVLLHFIYPRVFVCSDIYDSKYLFYELSNENSADTWIVSKITKNDYYSLVDGNKPIQNAYKNKKGFTLFVITKYYGNTEDRIELSTNTDEWITKLPKEPVYAEKEPFDDIAQETLQAARTTGETTFDIRLFPGTDRHFIPQNTLTELCSSITSLTNSVFGRRRAEALRVSTAPGSCIVRFSFPDQINLFNETDADDELKIINSVLSTDSLSGLEQVTDKPKFIKAYSKLLDALRKTKSDVQFTTASPNSTRIQKCELCKGDVKNRSDSIKGVYDCVTERETIFGTLIALDVKNKKFKLQLNNGSVVSGHVAKELLDQNSYELPKTYRALVSRVKYIYNDSSVKEVFSLIGLSN